jgi:hypothetical protein
MGGLEGVRTAAATGVSGLDIEFASFDRLSDEDVEADDVALSRSARGEDSNDVEVLLSLLGFELSPIVLLISLESNLPPRRAFRSNC